MAVLKKDKQEHEEVLCQHREIKCTEDCELLIPVKDLENHDCLRSLKNRVAGEDGLVISSP